MKRLFYLCLLLLVHVCVYAQQAKYVFFFIGDGMGVNQVNTTEMYLAALQGRIGTEPLTFGSFPVAGIATSYSASNPITDSAAGGTALATGTKTYNGAIGVDVDKQPLRSIATRAKASGKRVAILTTVGINHATPAAFYGHQPDRNMYDEIALELPESKFDFFAGSGILRSTDAPSLEPAIEKGGYAIAHGMDEYEEKADGAEKILLLQAEGADVNGLPYAVDHEEGDMTLAQMTEAAVAFLMKEKNKGFFLMAEGGKIDWACHNNDLGTVVKEVIDFDNAVKVAYEFYKKHPKETLIVISADHETGGLGMGYHHYVMDLKALENQKVSQEELSRRITTLRKQTNVSWEQMKELLSETMGFWTRLPLTWEQERMLRDEYEKSFVQHKVEFAESLYARSEPLAAVARKVMSQIARVGWTTGDHSAEYVPVYAVGAGSEKFMGKIDNTDIPKRIAKVGGYK